MDYTKFPKHRGLPPSMQGERQARFLGTLGAPALRRRNLDGSVSSKVGDRLYVTPADQDLGRLCISGALIDGKTGTFRSPNVRTAFRYVGELPFLADDHDLGYLVNNSDGTGSVADAEFDGYAEDFDYRPPGDPNGAWDANAGIVTSDVYRSRDGVTADLDFGGYSSNSMEWSNSAGGMQIVPGQFIMVGGQRVPLRGAATITLEEGGHYWPNFLRRVDDGPLQWGGTYGQENLMLDSVELLVLGPGRFLLVAHCMRSVHRPTLATNAANPFLIVQYTVDGGQTWSMVTGLSALADEVATLQLIPLAVPDDASNLYSDIYANHFNRASYYTAFSDAAPISATKALALLTIPYNDYENSGGVQGEPLIGQIRARVKVVEIDTSAGCSITAKQTLFEGRLMEAVAHRGTAIPTGDGMLFTLNDVQADDPSESAWEDAPTKPAKVHFTATGSDLASIGTLPFPACRTGYPTFVSPAGIACPMYADGAHWLYLSRDRMATWERGALITNQGVAPEVDPLAPLDSLSLWNFRAVARLRTKDGKPANLHPQAPWIMDCRFPAPE